MSSNTALINLLQRTATPDDCDALVAEGWTILKEGARAFTLEHAEWLVYIEPKMQFRIKDLKKPQDMYFFEEISIEKSLRVGNIKLSPQGNRQVTTQTKVGLYNISKTELEWCTQIKDTMLKIRNEIKRPLDIGMVYQILREDPEYINDDNLIMKIIIDISASTTTFVSILVVTDDKKMIKYAFNKMPSIVLASISPEHFYR